MLTLVAVVLAYDIDLETCDRRSSIVEADEVARFIFLRSFVVLSLKDKSWTRLENDILCSIFLGSTRVNSLYERREEYVAVEYDVLLPLYKKWRRRGTKYAVRERPEPNANRQNKLISIGR